MEIMFCSLTDIGTNVAKFEIAFWSIISYFDFGIMIIIIFHFE